MPGIRNRALAGMTLTAMVIGLTSSAHAQLFRWPNPCQPCGQLPVPIVPMASVAAAPMMQTASVSDCPCLKPVTETVYQDVDQVEYRTVQKTVKSPKVVTVMEDRDVVTYQQITEQRTVDVPSYITQTVTEMKPVAINQSYWQTSHQAVQKCSPCEYDPRPGLLGEFNRLGIAMRNSFTPNYVTHRQFVPNVVTAEVPMQRTVQIPTTRQVTYNVARTVPVTTTQKVAVQRTVWEDQTVTAYEPYVTRKTVAVGTRTRMAYVDPTQGSTTAAAEPTPATAEGNKNQTSENGKGAVRLQSLPQSSPAPVRFPGYPQTQPQAAPPAAQPPQAQFRPSTNETPQPATPDESTSLVRASGWKATRPEHAGPSPAGPLDGPILSVARK